MKTLLLMRHAKSSWNNANLTDHERPLDDRGHRDAPRMGQLVFEEDLIPDLIVASTATRARSTAQHVAENCEYLGEVIVEPDLYHAAPDNYLTYLRALPDDNAVVLMVGHNPGLEDLLEQVTGEYRSIPTAALAHLAFDIRQWREMTNMTTGQLLNFWRPKHLND